MDNKLERKVQNIFIKNIIIYTDHSKENPKMLLEICDPSKIVGYEINIKQTNYIFIVY